MRKRLMGLLLACSMTVSFFPMGTLATETNIHKPYVDTVWSDSNNIGWQSDNTGWWYNDANGNYVTGWRQIGGTWYYFNESGYMQTGWQWIDGNCYYFYPSGAMATDTWIDGSYVNGSGVWVDNTVVTGWQSDNTGWWYNDANGNYVTGWQQIDGTWYYFNGSGYMQTGWMDLGGNWYYFTSSGAMVTGAQTIAGKTYYFDQSGRLQDKVGMLVWVVADGRSYHNHAGCSNMENPYQITLQQAQAEGRKPCRKCYH